MKKPVTNIAASVRAKLLAYSRATRQEFQFVLDRWVAERFLFRLGRSPLRERFVLKGATLFLIWRGALPRRTRDVDLLGYGSPDMNEVLKAVRQICAVSADDGIIFREEGIRAAAIREDAEYDAIRVRIPATLDRARTNLQIDIGFGDVVNPAAEDRELPAILGMDPASLKAYPPEAVVAEKLQAMVQLDMLNSRMKDFYDIWLLSQEQTFRMTRLGGAVAATFKCRKTELPVSRPVALTGKFLRDQQKVILWREFLDRTGLPQSSGGLMDVGAAVAVFLMPVVEYARGVKIGELYWPVKGPWTSQTG